MMDADSYSMKSMETKVEQIGASYSLSITRGLGSPRRQRLNIPKRKKEEETNLLVPPSIM